MTARSSGRYWTESGCREPVDEDARARPDRVIASIEELCAIDSRAKTARSRVKG
jgi:hypothetical protein